MLLYVYGLQQAFFIERGLRSTRDTWNEGVEEKETSCQVHRIWGHAHVAWGKCASRAKQAEVTLS